MSFISLLPSSPGYSSPHRGGISWFALWIICSVTFSYICEIARLVKVQHRVFISLLFCSVPGNAYRECLGNGTWASKINYSQCEPILDDKVCIFPFIVSTTFLSIHECKAKLKVNRLVWDFWDRFHFCLCNKSSLWIQENHLSSLHIPYSHAFFKKVALLHSVPDDVCLCRSFLALFRAYSCYRKC